VPDLPAARQGEIGKPIGLRLLGGSVFAVSGAVRHFRTAPSADAVVVRPSVFGRAG